MPYFSCTFCKYKKSALRGRRCNRPLRAALHGPGARASRRAPFHVRALRNHPPAEGTAISEGRAPAAREPVSSHSRAVKPRRRPPRGRRPRPRSGGPAPHSARSSGLVARGPVRGAAGGPRPASARRKKPRSGYWQRLAARLAVADLTWPTPWPAGGLRLRAPRQDTTRLGCLRVTSGRWSFGCSFCHGRLELGVKILAERFLSLSSPCQ